MSSYPEAQPRKDYYEVVNIFTLGDKKVAELTNGKFIVLTPEEYLQARKGIFQHYASEKHPEGGYTLDQLLDSIAGSQGRESYSDAMAYNHGLAENFESEHSYSVAVESNRGVEPMSKNNMMMNVMVLGGAALVGFYFDRIMGMFRGGNGNGNGEESNAESMQSAANQGFMEDWQGGNSGNPADDPRLESKTLQGPVQDEPQIRYDYQPNKGPSPTFHDSKTRQTGFFEY